MEAIFQEKIKKNCDLEDLAFCEGVQESGESSPNY